MDETSKTTSVKDEVMEAAYRQWYGGLVLFCGFMVIGVAFWYGYFFNRQVATSPREIVASPPAAATQPPTTSPLPQSLTLSVLNGSGKKGEAQRVAALLQKQGYTIITIANAPTQQSGGTVVLTASAAASQPQLKSVLTTAQLAPLTWETLPPTQSAPSDVKIIIGK